MALFLLQRMKLPSEKVQHTGCYLSLIYRVPLLSTLKKSWINRAFSQPSKQGSFCCAEQRQNKTLRRWVWNCERLFSLSFRNSIGGDQRELTWTVSGYCMAVDPLCKLHWIQRSVGQLPGTGYCWRPPDPWVSPTISQKPVKSVLTMCTVLRIAWVVPSPKASAAVPWKLVWNRTSLNSVMPAISRK